MKNKQISSGKIVHATKDKIKIMFTFQFKTY